MVDEDEFGDLYTDVLHPLETHFQRQHEETGAARAAGKAAAPQGRPIDLNVNSDDEEILYGAPDLKSSNLNPSSALGRNLNASVREKTVSGTRGSDLNLESISAAARIDGLVGSGGDGSGFEARVLEKGEGVELRGKASARSSFMEEDDDDDINIIVEKRENKDEDIEEKDDNFVDKEDKMYISAAQKENTMNFVTDAVVDEMGQEQMIPGLSRRLETARASNIEDDWESEESEDDLQIVLNVNNHGPMGMERMPGVIDEDDEDGEPLVIVGVNGDLGHHHQHVQRKVDDQEWAGEEGEARVDGDKDLGDASKASGGGGGAAPAAMQPKIAISNHGYHHPFPSQFKYVRPGAAPGAIPGQVWPPVNMGPSAGRGRGDWRPAGIKGALPIQKGLRPGYGIPAWGVNAAGRGYGSGLDFTLPSHKSIFEVDIDSFEEKPWKLPGVDISDFFNFGFNEDSWRDYCKLLEQLRLEMTMQSKIRVYESGRAEQDYDPDLPPELAAAVGIQNYRSENANQGKVDDGLNDSARATARERPPLPFGRPIPVETGCGDRLPSIDTRRPRMLDSDVIIEILRHSSTDGDDMAEQQDNDSGRKDLGLDQEAGGLQPEDADHMNSLSPAYNGQKKEVESRKAKAKNTVSNDEILREDVLHFPPEASVHSHPDKETGVPHEERFTKGRRHVRSPMMSASKNRRGKHATDDLKEESFHSGDGKNIPALSPSHTIGADGEQAVIVGDEINDGSVVDDRSSDIEREEMAVDAPNRDTRKDGDLMHSTKRQKLSSLVEQLSQEYDDGEDSKAARSSDNSKAKSGSGKDHQGTRDDSEDEVLQDRHPPRAGNIKKEVGDEDNAHRKDHYDRDEAGRQNMVVKGREDSFSDRGGDANSSFHWHVKSDSADWRKERDISEGSWHQRDEDHRGKRTRVEDQRKREHGWDISSRNWGKLREREKSEKDVHQQSRNQLDNGSRRDTNHDRDIVGSKQRARDDNLKSRIERVDELHSTRRKEEVHIRWVHEEKEEEAHIRRVHAEKEDLSHNHRENSTGRKRERDYGSDQRKRDGQARLRDDSEHYARQKEGGSFKRERSQRQRERDEWYRIEQDEVLSRREGEESRPVMRSGRAAEEKTWISRSRGNDDYKGSSREFHLKDVVRHSDQLKQRDQVEYESFSQRRSHEDVHARGSQLSNDEKRGRYERPGSRDGRASYGSDASTVHAYKRKESSRKSRELEGGDHSSLISSKRNQDGDGGLMSETVNLRDRTELQSGHGPVNHRSSRKHGEEASTDDEQPDSRRGRSKLERWTSHKERDFGITSMPSSSLKRRDRDTYNGSWSSVGRPPEESSKKMGDKPQPLVDDKDTGAEMNNDNPEVAEDIHLNTVAKLKKRSERFKLPMPSEKDTIAIKKRESEPLSLSQTETHPDSEIKSERPARKRRWTGN